MIQWVKLRIKGRRRVILTQYCNSPRWFLRDYPDYCDYETLKEALNVVKEYGLKPIIVPHYERVHRGY